MRCLERWGKATQHNQKDKATQHISSKALIFKETLTASGGIRTYDTRTLGNTLTNWATEAAQLGGPISHTNQRRATETPQPKHHNLACASKLKLSMCMYMYVHTVIVAVCVPDINICITWYSHLLLRKREDPEQRSFPSAMIAILSPSKSASSLKLTAIIYAYIHAQFLSLYYMYRVHTVYLHKVCGE